MTALAVFFVLYWGAINYLLNRGEAIKFTSRNTKVEIKVESGWSLWPGVLHANGAFVQVQDYNIEMQIEAKRATLDFAPTSALRGIIHIESLMARGTRFRMLARVKDGQAARLRIAAFPPLSDRPSYYDAPRKSPAKPAKLKIDEIDAELRELWLMEYHAVGKIRASGTVKVLEDVNVNDAHVDMNDVTIHVGERLFAEHFNTDIQANIGPFPAQKPTAKQALTSIDATVKLDTQVKDLSIVELYSPDGPLRLEGESHLNVNIKAKAGRLLKSSTAQLKSQEIEAALEGRVFPFALDLEVNAPSKNQLQITGSIVGSKSDSAPFVWGAKSIQVDAELEQPESLSLRLQQGTFEWEGATLSEPGFVRKVAADDALPLIKVADFSGELQLKKSTKQSDFTLKSANGQFSIFPAEKMSVGCRVEASGHCTNEDQTWACSDIKTSCEPLVLTRDGSSAPMTVHLEAPQLAREAKGTWNSTIHFSGSNPKEILLDVAASNVLEKIGAAAAPLGPLSGSASLAFVPAQQEGPATIVGDLTRFESGGLSLRGHFVSAVSLKSRWIVELGPIKVGVKQSHKGVELELDPSASWLETN